MSNKDLTWSNEDRAAARSEGWRLAETIDMGSKRPYLMVATAMTTKVLGFGTDQLATKYVTQQAQLGGALHQRALAISIRSRMPAQPKSKP